jgi:hypothetical protein
VHEDFGVFSYDSGLKKIVWRQFHSEGLVNEYILESAGADGKSLEFVTTKIENLPSFRDNGSFPPMGSPKHSSWPRQARVSRFIPRRA